MRSYYPRELPPWFGLFRVRSPLLTESIFLSLPPGTEMFQFPGLARVLPDQSPFDGSPELIAVCHALEPPGAKTSPTRPYELGRTTPYPALTTLTRRKRRAKLIERNLRLLALALPTDLDLLSFQGPCLSVNVASRNLPQGLSKRCYSHHLVVKDRTAKGLYRPHAAGT